MWAWSRSSRRSAPPGGWTGRGLTRRSLSSASTRLDRLAVVSLAGRSGPPRRGGSRPARVLGRPRVRRPWHRSWLWTRVGWSHPMRSRWERYTRSVVVLRPVPLALRLGVERPESDGGKAPSRAILTMLTTRRPHGAARAEKR
eukprot:3079692-Pleurochrysis_carterae.AAC.1